MKKIFIILFAIIAIISLLSYFSFAQSNYKKDNYIYVYLTAKDIYGKAFGGTFKLTAEIKSFNKDSGEWIRKDHKFTIRTRRDTGEGWTHIPSFSFRSWVTDGKIDVYINSINRKNYVGGTRSYNSKKVFITVHVNN